MRERGEAKRDRDSSYSQLHNTTATQQA